MSLTKSLTKQQQFLLLIVFVVVSTCNASQLRSRFFYQNQDVESTVATGGGSAAESTPENAAQTNVHLLRDTGSKPLEFYMELNNVNDVGEFIERFVDKDSIDPQLGIVENLKRNVERAAAIVPKPAVCMPENQAVPLLPLTPSIDPNIIYFPSCTRIKRCGGCCNHALMSCQPTETKLNNYKVLKYNTQNNKLIGQEVIVVEEHVKCACDCTIKETDCNAYQTYDVSRCVCICNNADARSKCSREENKIWDEQHCRCVCRENISCSTGTFYDHNQCACVKNDENDPAIPPVIVDRKRFIIKATAIETDNSTIYDTI